MAGDQLHKAWDRVTALGLDEQYEDDITDTIIIKKKHTMVDLYRQTK